MTNRIFIDTLFVVALVNRRDQYHEQAATLSERFDGHPLLVTDAVLLEIGNALSRNYKEEAVRIMDELLASDEVDVVRLSPHLFDKASSMYKTYLDKEWSLVAWQVASIGSGYVFGFHSTGSSLSRFDHIHEHHSSGTIAKRFIQSTLSTKGCTPDRIAGGQIMDEPRCPLPQGLKVLPDLFHERNGSGMIANRLIHFTLIAQNTSPVRVGSG